MNSAYQIDSKSKKNSFNIILPLLAVAALIICLGYASYWSFEQTLDFLRPAFDTLAEAIVFAVIIQYGPQPALFYMGVFWNRLSVVKRKRDVWFAEHDEADQAPLNIVNDIMWNYVYLAISSFFFFGLSFIDFLTNLGEVNNTRDLRAAGGIPWTPLLYYVMASFSFIVLWAEELIGNLFVFFFILVEDLSTMFAWKGISFSGAQKFFRKASGPLDLMPNSGRNSTQTYPKQNVRNTPISRPTPEREYDIDEEDEVPARNYIPPYPRPAPRPRTQGELPTSPRPEPTYHPISYRKDKDN